MSLGHLKRPPMKKFFVYAKNGTENEIRNSILYYLKYRGYVCKRNNAGYVFITGVGGKKRAINIGEAGWPDIEGMTKEGTWFGIEVKTATGKMSPIQEAMRGRITGSKGIYVLARNLQDVIDAQL